MHSAVISPAVKGDKYIPGLVHTLGKSGVLMFMAGVSSMLARNDGYEARQQEFAITCPVILVPACSV